jgi:hypothetical protein
MSPRALERDSEVSVRAARCGDVPLQLGALQSYSDF